MTPRLVRERMKVVWREEPRKDKHDPKKLKGTLAIIFEKSILMDERDSKQDPDVKEIAERTLKDQVMRHIYGDHGLQLRELLEIALESNDPAKAMRANQIGLELRRMGLMI